MTTLAIPQFASPAESLPDGSVPYVGGTPPIPPTPVTGPNLHERGASGYNNLWRRVLG